MCGIAGIVGCLNDTHRAALRRMSAAMVHRGPDADGTWESTADERGWGAKGVLDIAKIRALTPR